MTDQIFERVLAATGHVGIARDAAAAAAIPEVERCEWCNGTGNEFYAMYHRCPKCDGTGRAPGESGEVTE